jgi:hypothetical protein
MRRKIREWRIYQVFSINTIAMRENKRELSWYNSRVWQIDSWSLEEIWDKDKVRFEDWFLCNITLLISGMDDNSLPHTYVIFKPN